MATKVLIVDDHPAVREGLAVRIASQPDMEVCGEAADTAEAVKLLEAARPDVVVVDIQLETGNGLDLVERIKARDESIGILVWSMYPDAIYAQRALHGRRPGLHQQAARDRPDRRGHSPRSRRQDLPLRRDRRAVAGPVRSAEANIRRQRGWSPFRTANWRSFVSSARGSPLPKSPAVSIAASTPWNRTARNIKEKLALKTAGELNRAAAQWMLDNG